MNNFENFIGLQIAQRLETLEAVIRILATRATVSSCGKEMTIVFDDHEGKELVMDFLTGTQPDDAEER